MIKLKTILNEIKKFDVNKYYVVDKRPNKKVKELVDSILKDIRQLVYDLGFGANVKIIYVTHDVEALAKYNGIIDSTNQPIITMSTRVLYKWTKQYGYNLDREVERVLVHELGHAYLELEGLDTRTQVKNSDKVEDVVESFAQFFVESRNNLLSKKILDDFVENYSFHTGHLTEGEKEECPRCHGWKHVYVRAGIPNIITKCPVCVDKPKDINVYRGVSQYNKKENNWYTTDKEWARQFTQSGLDNEIIKKKINTSKIMKRENVPLPQAVNTDEIDQAIEDAKFGKYDAFWVDEGKNEPPSIYVINKQALR